IVPRIVQEGEVRTRIVNLRKIPDEAMLPHVHESPVHLHREGQLRLDASPLASLVQEAPSWHLLQLPSLPDIISSEDSVLTVPLHHPGHSGTFGVLGPHRRLELADTTRPTERRNSELHARVNDPQDAIPLRVLPALRDQLFRQVAIAPAPE